MKNKTSHTTIINNKKFQKCTGPCGLEKELTADNFYWRKDINNWRTECSECKRKKEKEKHIKKQKITNIIIVNGVEFKKCTGNCGQFKELNKKNFDWRNDTNNWVGKCRNCKSEHSKKYINTLNKQELKTKRKEYNTNNKEKIKICGQKYRENNKEKIKEAKKEYLKNNEEKIKAQAKEYRDNNKEKIEKYYKEYLAADENIKKRNKYYRDRYHNNLAFRLRDRMSGSIRNAMKKNKSKKSKSIMKSVSYTGLDLVEHMVSKFEWWMTKENYGIYDKKTWDDNYPSTWTWQIDHIIPVSDFNFTSEDDEDFKKCFAIENLRPYSAKQNVLDGASRIRHKKKSL